MPFVLLVTFVVMAITATMLGSVTQHINPAVQSQRSETALSAAQAGVQMYVAELNANCNTYSIQTCSFPRQANGSATSLDSGVGTAIALSGASYHVEATNPQNFLNQNNNTIRVLSTGCVPRCSAAGARKITLLADISGVPNVLRFAYFTNFESYESNLLKSLYPSRTIGLSVAAARNVGSTTVLPTSVTWPGIADASTCDKHWYDGRSTGTNDTITETATSLPTGVSGPITDSHGCSVTFSKGMTFTGPVYSQDAFYISNGFPQTADRSDPGTWTGPAFSVPTACSATVTTNCEPLAPASSAWTTLTDANTPYRPYPAPLGGRPQDPTSVKTSPFSLALPNNANDAKVSCTTTGDVTISFAGAAATLSGAYGPCGATISPIANKVIRVAGNASLSGDVATGKVSVIATQDITITGNLTAGGATAAGTNEYNEKSYPAGSTAGAIALVATHDVILKHDVTCATGTATTGGYCPNDVTGLYANPKAVVDDSTGVLKSTHPARQYCNTTGNSTCNAAAAACDSSASTARTVQAAIFALTGSFRTDNFNRGCALGILNVTGGIYQSHRGPLGQEWEVSTARAATARPFSGYRLNLTYESLQYAGLPYVPALRGGTANHPWLVVAVSTAQNGTG